MSREKQIINERLRKLDELRKNGINPYPYKFEKKNSIGDCLKSKIGHSVKTAGRVIIIRDIGKIIFGKIRDETGEIQIVFQEGETPGKVKELFKKYVDSGDFVGVEGRIFRTKTKELSILVNKLEILSKSILPLPEKFHGLQDKEERYRKRYLDLIISPEVKRVFEKRTKILDAIREFMNSKGFEEVDTPYLQTIYGGANAKPFKTHLNALNIDLFLSISPELYLKRLIVGGYEKVYTIARNFRNEGIDRWHNPEFTMMEIYAAYWDYNDMMELFEDLYIHVCKKINGSTKVNFKGKEIDFKKPWKKMTMREAIKKFAKIDVEKTSEKELNNFIKKNNIKRKGEWDSWGWSVQSIFEHFCEGKLEEPTFILDHPLETTPLCKTHRNDKMCRLIERFEPFCMGAELGNAYSELNDPILQRKLLEEQQKMLSKGNEEANPYDEDFVNAIEIGMPPTGGLGVGIDRMIMLLTGQDSIRDVILFPFMKPEDLKERKEGKAKETKIAVVVINNGLKLEPWERMNTIAHLNAALGARVGRILLTQDKIETKDKEKINLNIQHAIMIKTANSNNEIKDLVKKAKENELEVSEFIREMIKTTNDKEVIEWTKAKNFKDIEYLGALIFGKRKDVEKLTENFKLFK